MAELTPERIAELSAGFRMCHHPEWPTTHRPAPVLTVGTCPEHNYACPVCGFGVGQFPPCSCASAAIATSDNKDRLVELSRKAREAFVASGRNADAEEHEMRCRCACPMCGAADESYQPEPAFGVHIREAIAIIKDWWRNR